MFEIKTLIELFDVCQVENAIAGLRFKPEKIVFVGFKETMTSTRQKALLNFFENRVEQIIIEFEIVGRYDFESIVERFNSIIDRNEDCGFDLTGGKELVLAAMGAVSALREVPMFQIDVASGNIAKIKNCDELPITEKSAMSIEEAIALNGCSVVDSEDIFSWNFTNEFKKDIDFLWDICRQDFRLWNKQCFSLSTFDGTILDGLTVRVDLHAMKYKPFMDETIINPLIENGYLQDYEYTADELTYRYRDHQIHQVLTKAGNILELISYILFNEIADETPGYYDDIDMGVFIDWDGVIHSRFSKSVDTRNEIDIMLTRDLVPIFISCKNGEVNKEALYELNTVSRKFGGKYAKRFMIASVLCQFPAKNAFLRQRAADMDISLLVLSDYKDLSRENVKQLLREHIK